MPNLQLLLDDIDIASMQQPESFILQPKPEPSDSSLSPSHQEYQSIRQRNHQHEQEKLQDGSIRKRKWEYDDDDDDEASSVGFAETPRKSSIKCYCPPLPPRKPKATPAMRRRAMWVKRSTIFLDVAREVESMFPPSLLQDFGKKIKKARS